MRKIEMTRIVPLHIGVLALTLFLANFANAQDAEKRKPVKIAIIGDTEKFLPQLDMLTVKLSEDPNLSLLERSDWNYLLRERTISASKIGQSGVEIGRLLGADALIILTEDIVANKKVLLTKLVAVKSGVILDSIASPVKSNKETFDLSSEIEFRFKPKIEKLNSQTKKTVISMLNIRAAISSPDLLAVEHDLNAILAHRLMREQNLLVSERWNMAEADLENNLGNSTPPKYASGSVILDGVISAVDKKTIEVKLTFQKSDGTKRTVKVKGRKDAIIEIVDELTDKCLEITDTLKNPKAWDTTKEADEYLKEGVWAEAAGLYLKAAKSAESAWALGNRSEALAYLRIRSYANATYPEYCVEHVIRCHKIGENARYLDAAIMALDLYKHHIIKGQQKPKKKFGLLPPDYYSLGRSVLAQAAELLARYYNQKLINAFPEKQAAVRKLIRECLEFLLKGEEQSRCACNYFSGFTLKFSKYFIASDDELIKMYKRILGRRCLIWRPLKANLRERCAFFYIQSNPPFYIDRSGNYDKKTTLEFIKKIAAEFAKSNNLQLQLDSLMIGYIFGEETSTDPSRFSFEENPKYLPLIYKFYDEHKKFFWKHKIFPIATRDPRYNTLKFPYYYYTENLQHRNFRTIYCHSSDFDTIIPDLSYKKKKELYGILRKRFSKEQIADVAHFSKFLKAIVPKEEVVEIKPDKKILPSGLDTSFQLLPGMYSLNNNKIYIPYIQKSPETGTIKPKEEALYFSLVIVDIKTKQVKTISYQPVTVKLEDTYFTPLFTPLSPSVLHNGKLYLINYKGLIYGLDLNGGEIEIINLHIQAHNSYINIMNNKIYATFLRDYVNPQYDDNRNNKDNAMVEYDLETKKQKFIFYSRRKPPQTPLDARSYDIKKVIQLSEKYILVKTSLFYIVDVETGTVKNLKDMPPMFMKDYMKYTCRQDGAMLMVFKHSQPPFSSMIDMYLFKFRPWGKNFLFKGVPRYDINKDSLSSTIGWPAYYMLIHNTAIPRLLIDGRMKPSSISLRNQITNTCIYGLTEKKHLKITHVFTPYKDSYAIVNTEYGAFQIGKTGNMPILFYKNETLKRIFENPGAGINMDVKVSMQALEKLKKVKYDGSAESFKKIQKILTPEVTKDYKIPLVIAGQATLGLSEERRFYKILRGIYSRPISMETKTLEKWLDFVKSESDSGNLFYKNVLGVLYSFYPRIIKQDVKKAHALWKEAADAGSMLAELKMGNVLSNLPHPTEKQKKEIIYYYKKAADQGSIPAALRMGVLYHGLKFGPSDFAFPLDAAKAIKYYQLAIDGGNGLACRNLGLMYVHGTGVKVDIKKAEALFEKGWKLGDEPCNGCRRAFCRGRGK